MIKLLRKGHHLLPLVDMNKDKFDHWPEDVISDVEQEMETDRNTLVKIASTNTTTGLSPHIVNPCPPHSLTPGRRPWEIEK